MQPDKALCSCGCGRPHGPRHREWADACWKRWDRADRPASGPPPVMPQSERLARANAVRGGGTPSRTALPVDGYDRAWAAGEPERRIRRVNPLASDLIRCVAQSDAEGISVLMGRIRDWPALAIVLAECAAPARTMTVTAPPVLVAGQIEDVA
jgi:hypothetical protein